MIKALEGIGKVHWVTGLLLTTILISWMVYQQSIINAPVEVVNMPFDPACDLRAGPCETILNDGSRVSFAILPLDIPVSKTLTLEVTVTGLAPDNVAVDINGVEMKMPPNIVNLESTGKGLYSGKGALSFCTRSIMEWESVIILGMGNKQINLPFRFITSDKRY